MEKVIYYCKKCRSTFGSYPNSGKIKCQECDNDLVCTDYSVYAWRQLSEEEKENKRKYFAEIVDDSYKADTDYNGESTIGRNIKNISYIFMLIAIIGSIIVMLNNLLIGIVVLLVSLLECFLCIAIGEICNLLNSINNKLK